MPTYYKRFVNDTLTIISNKASEDNFLEVLNQRHSSIKLPWRRTVIACFHFWAPSCRSTNSTYADTKVYVKPSNTGLLLHYKSHVDDRYKSGLLKTMLDRTFRLSSNWCYFSEECDRLKLFYEPVSSPAVSDRSDSIRHVYPTV